MIGIIARLNVAEGKGSEFEAVFAKLVAKVRENEPGNHLYTLVKNDSDYVVMELYDDDAALAAHGSADYFREIGREMAPFMAGAPTLERFEVVTP